MDSQIDNLVAKTWVRCHDIPRSRRLLIAVSGIPGSGKTTLASMVVARLNAMYRESSPGSSQGGPLAAFVPLDGYHLSRAQLDKMPNPKEAHFRRGADFTFDGDGFLHLVKQLRRPLAPETRTIRAPSFDHAIKDPIADDIPIGPRVKVVIFEGNYLSLNKAPWKDSAELMDELWYVDVDKQTAIERLAVRHARAGITNTVEEGRQRAIKNDMVNGQEVMENRVAVDEIVISKEDEDWKSHNQNYESD
ncbi:P-loop containing nucleoside triphosphate hydrolase protein [Aulographum hederae CBS 113979]|uniref:P-loop containing nucleoside triphosphate hydrolase protein n=1 Tax=Aulographum hederae CBS 113979 TaxID=1176131 RepID=A0A6G1GQ29_9PEZI|nr:P-loop containing nucleoside triphosphate hydrolase protein [Aulographum hederae CBS 113979]